MRQQPSNAELVAYSREVQAEIDRILEGDPSRAQLAFDLAIVRLHLRAADGLIAQSEAVMAAQERSIRAFESSSASTFKEAAAVSQLTLNAIELTESYRRSASEYRHQAESLREDAERGEKFKPKGRGKGPLRTLVRHVMAKMAPNATARQVWDECRTSSKAKKLKIEFQDASVWVDGQGNVGFARFQNIVSDERKAIKGIDSRIVVPVKGHT